MNGGAVGKSSMLPNVSVTTHNKVSPSVPLRTTSIESMIPSPINIVISVSPVDVSKSPPSTDVLLTVIGFEK